MRPRENPFRVECLEAIPFQFDGETLQGLLNRFQSLQFRAALTGVHGAGKSTLMKLISRTLQEQGESVRFLRVTEANRAGQSELIRDWFASSKSQDFLFLDGAEQLTLWNWYWVRRVSRTKRGLLVTAHKRGFLPTLYECRTSPELLTQLVSRLTGETSSRPFDDLFKRHQGNLRECLRELYDQAVQSDGTRPPESFHERQPGRCGNAE